MFVLQSQISAKQNKFLGISAIRPHIRAKWHIVHCACAKRPNYYFRSKIWGHHRVHRPGFPTKRGNFGDSWTFKADIAFFILAWVFRTSGSKMGIFRGEIGEGVRRYWPPTNSFLLLGVYMSVSNLVKIDEEMRPWVSTDGQTHTHAQTQNDFVICPMLYAIAMGQIIKTALTRWSTITMHCTHMKHCTALRRSYSVWNFFGLGFGAPLLWGPWAAAPLAHWVIQDWQRGESKEKEVIGEGNAHRTLWALAWRSHKYTCERKNCYRPSSSKRLVLSSTVIVIITKFTAE